MPKLTGRVFIERYAPGKKNNSFYEEQKLDAKVGKEYITGLPEVVYFIDKRSGFLSAKETTLLW